LAFFQIFTAKGRFGSEFFFAGRFNIRVTTLFFLLINSGSSGTGNSSYETTLI